MAHKPSSHEMSRRDWLKLSSAGVVGWSMSGWLGQLAQAAGNDPRRKRSCILLWMNGGPSQIDTFDPKPGHANGGEFSAIDTAVPGIRISEHLPRLAASMRDMSIIRSMSTSEADHGRATYFMRTGYRPGGPVNYPTLGSLVGRENGQPGAELPNFVSIAPFTFFSPAAYGPGFLGPSHGPLVLGNQQPAPPANQQQGNAEEQERQNQRRIAESLRVPDLDAPVSAERAAARFQLLGEMEQDFQASRGGTPSESHRSACNRAVTLMRSTARQAFELDQEPASLRDRYGRTLFGQGCLLARRLVERGVPFVEVTLGALDGLSLGWDTHIDNFSSVRRLSGILDSAWATLMDDLRDRGLLDSTLIVWMGEFGRTPRINGFGGSGGGGRDHWANCWSTVLAGGGIRGGQVYGDTGADGSAVTSGRPISVPDFLATVHRALGIDYTRQNVSDVGRPIRIVDSGSRPIQEVLA